MPNEQKTTLDELGKYLHVVNTQYLKASKLERGRLSEEMEAATCLNRKRLMRLTLGSPKRRPRRKQQGRTRGPEVDQPSQVIAQTSDCVCTEGLRPTLVQTTIYLACHDETEISPPFLDQLRGVSASTLGRIRESCSPRADPSASQSTFSSR